MIDKTNKEKIILTTREMLLFLADCLVVAQIPFDRNGMYRKTISDYFNWRSFDKKRFNDNLSRLRREKIIEMYLKDNKDVLELTDKGKRKIINILVKEAKFEIPDKWDKKWRMVIFDIPNEEKISRDSFRHRLKVLGFFQLQESVFVFPFDCKEYIGYLKNLLQIDKFIQYIVAEEIETQIDLLRKFIDSGLITKKMLMK